MVKNQRLDSMAVQLRHNVFLFAQAGHADHI
jgi:hypothetical protein